MIALGLMSGTSLDAIDLAVIETDGVTIDRLGPAGEHPIPPPVRAMVRAASQAVYHWQPGAPVPAEVAEAERLITEIHATAISDFIARHGAPEVIGFHGQTILHRPQQRLTWQIGDGQGLADRFGIDLVGRFRQADVAAGGQGAPLVPLYHRALAQGLAGQTAGALPLGVLNLGGVGNLTWIGTADEPPVAFDTGPGNALIDDWALHHTGRPRDHDGALAAAGRVDPAALAALLSHPYFARPAPKSLDRDDFSADPVRGLSAADGAATLTAFTIETIALSLDRVPRPPLRLVVTGGGRHNPALMAGLRQRLDLPVAPIESLGWRGDCLEAEAFAYLAVRSRRGLPLSLPTTTGVPAPQTGGELFRPAV